MIRLEHVEVEWTPDGATSRFGDGTHYEAFPHDTPHYRAITYRCGYGGDRMRYCREHEVFHHLAGEAFFDGPSPILWALAHGREMSPRSAAFEEAIVTTLQRWVRAGERPIIGGVDWDDLRRRAEGVLQ